MIRRAAALLLLFALALQVSSCGCTAIGCASGTHIALALPAASSSTAFAQSMVTLCRNSACFSATIPLTVLYEGTGTGLPFDMASPARGTLLHRSGDVYDLELDWYSSDLHNGDRYVVTVVDQTGQTIASVDRTVTYSKFEPNGERCGPTCVQASIDAGN